MYRCVEVLNVFLSQDGNSIFLPSVRFPECCAVLLSLTYSSTCPSICLTQECLTTSSSARGRIPATSGPSAVSASSDRQARSKSARRQGVVMLSPSSPDSSDDSFLSSNHRRPPGSSSNARRDRSVPPQLIEPDYEYAPQERPRRDRAPYETYLFPSSPGNANRYIMNRYSSSEVALE